MSTTEASPRLPRVGDIVLYGQKDSNAEGQPLVARAAIITRVEGPAHADSKVSLNVFDEAHHGGVCVQSPSFSRELTEQCWSWRD